MKRTTKVSLGLFATWAISDVEELWTMSRNSKDVLRKLPKALPIPEGLRRNGISQRQFNTGIGIMGLVMGAAAALGVRSNGRSPVFRGVLLGFGLHGFGHLAMAAAARQYVSGVVTAPTMVIPFWLWARRELAKEDIVDIDRTTVAVAAAGIPLMMGVHVLTYRLLKEQPARTGARASESDHPVGPGTGVAPAPAASSDVDGSTSASTLEPPPSPPAPPPKPAPATTTRAPAVTQPKAPAPGTSDTRSSSASRATPVPPHRHQGR